MIRGSVAGTEGKGWFTGPWASPVTVAIGFADRGVDDPHAHDQMCEVYLVARITSTIVVAGEPLDLAAGDMVVVGPGEAHTFTASSDDHLRFVV